VNRFVWLRIKSSGRKEGAEYGFDEAAEEEGE